MEWIDNVQKICRPSSCLTLKSIGKPSIKYYLTIFDIAERSKITFEVSLPPKQKLSEHDIPSFQSAPLEMCLLEHGIVGWWDGGRGLFYIQ